MTTHSDIQPYWFGRTETEIRNAVLARDEAWAPVPGYSRYEWSDKGSIRALARTDERGRRLAARLLSTRKNNAGYWITSVVRDSDAKQVTVTMGPMVLLAHHPAFRGLDRLPDGLETRHGPAGPLFNAYPENLWPGTKKENAADKEVPPEPQHPCRNHAVCGNLVHNEGKRCLPCTEAVGAEAGLQLDLGENLMTIAHRFGYTGPDWVYRLAVKYGGYQGTKAAALAQRPGITQRMRLAARARRSDAL